MVGGGAPRGPRVSIHADVVSRLSRSRGLSELANEIHGLGNIEGSTVQITQATRRGRTIFVAGINSSAEWTSRQTRRLRGLGIEIAERQTPEMRLADGGAPHAEQNIAAHLQSTGARGVRWSHGTVGASGRYLCRACRSIIDLVGGQIEPPFDR